MENPPLPSGPPRTVSRIKLAGTRFYSSNYFIPALALLSGIGFSIALFSVVSNQIEDEARLRFERQASDAHHVIQSRISSYVEVIRGLSALFHTSNTVSRMEFHRYVNGLKLERSYPGFQNLNYAQFVQNEDKTEFETNVRRDSSLNAQGYPDFSITPSGKRASYSVLIYQEPMASNASTFGKDLAASTSGALALAEKPRYWGTDIFGLADPRLRPEQTCRPGHAHAGVSKRHAFGYGGTKATGL